MIWKAGVNDSLDISRRALEEIIRNTEHLLANISCPITVSMHLLHTGRSRVNPQFSVLTTFFLLERFYDVHMKILAGCDALCSEKKKSKCRRRDDILPGYVTINTDSKKSYIFCHSDEEQH